MRIIIATHKENRQYITVKLAVGNSYTVIILPLEYRVTAGQCNTYVCVYVNTHSVGKAASVAIPHWLFLFLDIMM